MKSRFICASGFLFLVLFACFMCSPLHGQLVEGFDDSSFVEPPVTQGEVVPGWLGILRSDRIGITGIFNTIGPEGDTVISPLGSHSGEDSSVLNMNFQNAMLAATDTTSTWILTPELTMNNGDTVSFWTRSSTSQAFQDRLLLRLSTNGDSTDVGVGPMDVGDFDTVLLDINPNYEDNVYPTDFTEFVVTISGLAGPTQGRLAFHYFVEFMDVNGDVVAIDTFEYALGKVGDFVPPTEYDVFRGIELNGSIADYTSSDDISASYNPGFTIVNTEAPVWIIFDAVVPSATDFQVESSAGTPGLEYTAEAFNWASGTYDVVGVQAETFNTDQVVSFPIVGSDHIDASGNVRSRVGWRRIGFTINFPWQVNIDQAGWLQ